MRNNFLWRSEGKTIKLTSRENACKKRVHEGSKMRQKFMKIWLYGVANMRLGPFYGNLSFSERFIKRIWRASKTFKGRWETMLGEILLLLCCEERKLVPKIPGIFCKSAFPSQFLLIIKLWLNFFYLIPTTIAKSQSQG